MIDPTAPDPRINWIQFAVARIAAILESRAVLTEAETRTLRECRQAVQRMREPKGERHAA